ncbi:hypothetical protein [Nocardioides speluncae]|uniref:hypothetical protein n=1 Tax=Nocardioides speluncae TaxID=2670337 RepID=UPI000D698DFC|nr:hypothetical protein [Nocardioides speluncae]
MASIVVQIRIRLDAAKDDAAKASDSLATATGDLDRAHALLSSATLGSYNPQLKAAAAGVQRLSITLGKTSQVIDDAGRRASEWGHQL